MNQIWEHVGGGNRENSPTEVTLCLIIAPALLYIHQTAVSYLGQLCPQVIRRPQGTRYFGTRPLMPPQTWITNSPRNDLYSQGFVQKNECTVLLYKQNSGSSEENLTTYDDILFQLCDIFSTFSMPKKCVLNFSPRFLSSHCRKKKCIVCAPHHEFFKKDKQQKHSLLLTWKEACRGS